MIKQFKGTDIEFFFSESQEDGKYTFESDKFVEIDGRTAEEISKLVVKDIRSENVPQYILDEMYYWSRTKGFWTGILENVRKDSSTYWVKASIIKINSLQYETTHYGMISVPASEDDIARTKIEYKQLKNIKFDKELGLTSLSYALQLKDF
jgi:PAS domain-containing protein